MRENIKHILTTRFELRHYSNLGFASFVTALVIGLFVIFDLFLVLRFQNDPLLVSKFRVMDSWVTWAVILLAVCGIILGVGSMAQAHTKRIFGVVGLIVNALFLLTIFVLYISNTIAFWRLAGG